MYLAELIRLQIFIFIASISFLIMYLTFIKMKGSFLFRAGFAILRGIFCLFGILLMLAGSIQLVKTDLNGF